ncbi:MAG: hypothetical protein RLZZ136_949 [Pseudomonadota bacterium]|jgi:hypothetical protein
MRRLFPLFVLLMVSGCVQDIKESRINSALLRGGLPDDLAGCMAHRMAQKLTIAQLRQLQAMAAPRRSLADYVEAVRQSGNGEAVSATLTAAALCKTGLIR